MTNLPIRDRRTEAEIRHEIDSLKLFLVPGIADKRIAYLENELRLRREN